MIPATISKKILSVGPDYKDHRGGIGALIDVYKDQYEVYHFIPSYRAYKSNFKKILFFLQQLFKILYFLSKNKDIAILHIHSAKNGSLFRKLIIAFIAKVIFRKKIINHIHTGHFKHFYDDSGWLSKKSTRYFLSLNDLTITVSDFWKCYFIDHFHLQNVCRLKNIVANAETNAIINQEGPVVFLFLGIITKNKGIFDLVQVIAENKAILGNNIKLIICGSGEIDLLNDMISKYGLEGCIDFRGWVSGKEKETLLKSTDVYILPSYFEGVPISILEAMRYGKPIISTNVGGIPEIVESNANGLLVTPGDSKALLQALLFYICDRNNISRHGCQSLLKIKDHFPETITKQLEAIYSSLIS